ncbi:MULTISPECIES: nitrate ABC transporter ATP-binding protein [Haloarcula]|jgi:hypothetical protein|uniref:nitrate ABC transporter ATP-binding protein n=1 Tax=Haloarcula TaxID=2237 RepID=UPI000F8DB67E|nr:MULTISPECIES: nitrate ABC transporter ATP-binding protein [Haloarcula]
MANGIELLGFPELSIGLVDPATVKKPIDCVYSISVLFNILGLSQKELMRFSPSEFVST